MRNIGSILTLFRDGQECRTRIYPIFYYINGRCELRLLQIHFDGMITCDNDHFSILQLRQLVDEGVISTSIEDGESLHLMDLAFVRVTDVIPGIAETEFLAEIEDVVRELNFQPTTSDLCRLAFQEYLKEPSDTNRQRLKESYEMVPGHLLCWLMPFPEKDVPIRKAIYGSIE